MAYVVTLDSFVPPVRYDGHPWTEAQIGEAATPTGPFTLIDTQALSPLDPDPTNPEVRNFTTSLATLTVGWYQVTFFDAAGNQSQPSSPVRNSVDDTLLPPSPDQVRSQSRLLRLKYPLPMGPFDIIDLRNIVYQSVGLVENITWRLIDPTLGDPSAEGYTGEAVPPALTSVAYDAILRMAEHVYVITEPDFAEEFATGRLLRSFTAGPYSEQYFTPGEFARRGAQEGRPSMDTDPSLDAALWALATEDARDYFVWRSTGVVPPVGVAIAFDYRRQSIGYGAGALGGWPGRGGPDGY